MGLSGKTLAGPGYIILNALRVMNIISMLAVVAASMVMLVKTIMTTQFFFFDGLSHIITLSVSVFLIVSELSLFKKYFARHWPVLSLAHGFVCLGLAMFVLGVNILGNLNKSATSPENLGKPCWRVVIGSGCLVMIFGVFNIIASYVFRCKDLGVTARQVRSKGAVALAEERQQHQVKSLYKSYSLSTGHSGSSFNEKTPRMNISNPIPLQTAAAAPPPFAPAPQLSAMTSMQTGQTIPPTPPTKEHKRSSIRFPQFGRRPTLPSYSPAPSSKYSERPDGHQMEISGPLGINPQFAYLTQNRPDSSFHPSRMV